MLTGERSVIVMLPVFYTDIPSLKKRSLVGSLAVTFDLGFVLNHFKCVLSLLLLLVKGSLRKRN